MKSTRRDIFKLTQSNAVASALLFLTPLVLVRVLDQAEYGNYRLIWLLGNSAALIASMGIDSSLLYFLPRSNRSERAQFVSQTMLVFVTAGCIVALAFALGPLWLPESFSELTRQSTVLAIFGFLWLASAPIKVLPNADGNTSWQAGANLSLAVSRSLLVAGVALLTHDFQSVFLGILAFSVLQTAVLFYYVVSRYSSSLSWPELSGLKRQLGYAVPFGMSSLLTQARMQIEQWIVALLFVPGAIAIFAIGISFNAVLGILRMSLANVLLPKMSELQAGGDPRGSLELNKKGNIALCVVMFPFNVLLFTSADALVELLYTAAYLDAVSVLRVYAAVLLVMSVELATILRIYEQGRFVAVTSAIVLVGATTLSALGAVFIGLAGVAAGSLAGEIVNRFLNFRRAAQVAGVPFRKLQDWATLGKLLAASVGAGLLAFWASTVVGSDASVVLRLATSTGVMAVAYLGFIALFRAWWVVECLQGKRSWAR